MAFSGGQVAALDSVKEDFPYWRYSAVKDSRTRPSHRALDGKIFKTGDYQYYPPISFRCRCEAIPISASEAVADGIAESDLPADLTKSLGKTEFISNKNQKFLNWLERQTLSKEASEKVGEQLAILTAIFKPSIATQAEFEAFVDAVVQTKRAKGEVKIVGELSAKTKTFLQERDIKPTSDFVLVNDKKILHALRDAKSPSQRLSVEEIKQLPEFIQNPEAVLFDNEDDALIFIASGESSKSIKSVVRLNFKLKGFSDLTNLVVTAGKVESKNLMEKRYILVQGDLK